MWEGGCVTDAQRRLNELAAGKGEKCECIVCGRSIDVHRLHADICRALAPRKNQCYSCYRPLYGDCKEPQRPSKSDTVFRWCQVCFAKVGKTISAGSKRGFTETVWYMQISSMQVGGRRQTT